MMELLTAENGIALLTLAVLEIVLGIDNIVFISILTQRLPEADRAKARQLGLWAAMVMRIGLLFVISWVVGLTEPLFEVLGGEVSGRDLILLGGGLFLVAKATSEIHDKLEGEEAHGKAAPVHATFGGVLLQIAVLDMVFSLDSVITAVGMVQEIAVMIAAVIIAIAVMMIFAGPISSFIERRPTMKILALSFLILIGVVLIVEGFGGHVQKGYIYFAMAFSLGVELINQRIRKPSAQPVHLRGAGTGHVEKAGVAT
jgi:predicted tellurium resistance membrane protein TerC